jgi:hypothetical protein
MDHSPPFVFRFPEDIERLIFEQAAENDKRTALRLILIARRIQQWQVPQASKICR